MGALGPRERLKGEKRVAVSSLEQRMPPQRFTRIWLNHRELGASTLSTASDRRLRRKLRLEAQPLPGPAPAAAVARDGSGALRKSENAPSKRDSARSRARPPAERDCVSERNASARSAPAPDATPASAGEISAPAPHWKNEAANPRRPLTSGRDNSAPAAALLPLPGGLNPRRDRSAQAASPSRRGDLPASARGPRVWGRRGSG